MINVNEVKQYAEFLARKNQSGGAFTPVQFNLALPFVVRDIVRKYYGVPEQYSPQMPQGQIGYEVTQLVKDYLSNLRPTTTLTVDNVGYATLPEDYLHKTSCRYRISTTTKVDKLLLPTGDDDCACDDDSDNPTIQLGKDAVTNLKTTDRWVPVQILTDTQFDWAAASSMREPTKEFPIARMESSLRMRFLPTDLGQVELSYIRYPARPVWGYTTAGGFDTYDANTSTNIELPEICATEIVLMLLNKIGISIREPQLINYADRQRQAGS